MAITLISSTGSIHILGNVNDTIAGSGISDLQEWLVSVEEFEIYDEDKE